MMGSEVGWVLVAEAISTSADNGLNSYTEKHQMETCTLCGHEFVLSEADIVYTLHTVEKFWTQWLKA